MYNKDFYEAEGDINYRVFIKYCVFFEFIKIFWTLYSLGVSVYTPTRQVENHRCSRAGRVQKNHKILRKKNTIFNEHPVYKTAMYLKYIYYPIFYCDDGCVKQVKQSLIGG